MAIRVQFFFYHLFANFLLSLSVWSLDNRPKKHSSLAGTQHEKQKITEKVLWPIKNRTIYAICSFFFKYLVMYYTRSVWHNKLTNIFLCSFPRSDQRERERESGEEGHLFYFLLRFMCNCFLFKKENISEEKTPFG